jgi:hypothetical protein
MCITDELRLSVDPYHLTDCECVLEPVLRISQRDSLRYLRNEITLMFMLKLQLKLTSILLLNADYYAHGEYPDYQE